VYKTVLVPSRYALLSRMQFSGSQRVSADSGSREEDLLLFVRAFEAVPFESDEEEAFFSSDF